MGTRRVTHSSEERGGQYSATRLRSERDPVSGKPEDRWRPPSERGDTARGPAGRKGLVRLTPARRLLDAHRERGCSSPSRSQIGMAA